VKINQRWILLVLVHQLLRACTHAFAVYTLTSCRIALPRGMHLMLCHVAASDGCVRWLRQARGRTFGDARYVDGLERFKVESHSKRLLPGQLRL
jgi:hypothetical protein